MTSVLDQIMYGETWRTVDAAGRRVELYGPWRRALRAEERRRFPLRELWDVRRAMRDDGHESLGFVVYGPLVVAVAMGAAVLLPLSNETEGWMLAGSLLVMMVLYVNGALSVPAAPAAFARAMIRKGRCPGCAGKLGEAVEGVRGCSECAVKWRPARTVQMERGAWECVDDRGRAAALYRPGMSIGRMDEGFRAQFKSIRRAALGGDTRRAYFGGAVMAIMGVYYMAGAAGRVVDGQYWTAALLGGLGAAMAANAVHAARWGVGDDSRRFLRAMLEHGRCPACAYDISGSAVEEDGCTVCAECGGAWRMGTPEGEL